MEQNEKIKLNLLISVAETLLNPTAVNFDNAKANLEKLAKHYHLELRRKNITDTSHIETKLLKNIGEIIINKYGYIESLPEIFTLLSVFEKNKL